MTTLKDIVRDMVIDIIEVTEVNLSDEQKLQIEDIQEEYIASIAHRLLGIDL